MAPSAGSSVVPWRCRRGVRHKGNSRDWLPAGPTSCLLVEVGGSAATVAGAWHVMVASARRRALLPLYWVATAAAGHCPRGGPTHAVADCCCCCCTGWSPRLLAAAHVGDQPTRRPIAATSPRRVRGCCCGCSAAAGVWCVHVCVYLFFRLRNRFAASVSVTALDVCGMRHGGGGSGGWRLWQGMVVAGAAFIAATAAACCA